MILPRISRSQPNNWFGFADQQSCDLVNGITFAYCPTFPQRGLVRNRPVSSRQTTFVGSTAGRCIQTAGGANDGVFWTAPASVNGLPLPGAPQFTIAVLAAPTLTAVKTAMFCQRNPGGSGETTALLRGTTGLAAPDLRGWQLYYRDTSGNPYYADNELTWSNPPDGLMHLWGGTLTQVAGSPQLDIWRDGVLATVNRTTPGAGTFASTSQSFCINNFPSSDGSWAAACPNALVLVWGRRALNASEWKQLANNPWQVFADLMVYIAAATGTLKTWDGLAKGSIKTFQGLAKASTKTVNGLTP